MGGKKNIEKLVMDGRCSKGISDFVNSGSKFWRPKAKQRERMQKAMVYHNSLNYLEQKSIHNDSLPDGLKMFNNSWGMGPFYSYNHNFKNLKEYGGTSDTVNNDQQQNFLGQSNQNSQQQQHANTETIVNHDLDIDQDEHTYQSIRNAINKFYHTSG